MGLVTGIQDFPGAPLRNPGTTRPPHTLKLLHVKLGRHQKKEKRQILPTGTWEGVWNCERKAGDTGSGKCTLAKGWVLEDLSN